MFFAPNWTEAEAISTSILVLTSAGGIFYAGRQLRHERQYRAITNLEKQLEFFHSKKFVESRKALARERLSGDLTLMEFDQAEPPVSFFPVLDFYEHLGLLVKKGHLEVYDVWHTFYEWIQPVYSDIRVALDDPANDWAQHYSDLRRLVRNMDRIQNARLKRRSQHTRLWSPERTAEHYQYELESQGESVPRRLRAGRRGSVVAPNLVGAGAQVTSQTLPPEAERGL